MKLSTYTLLISATAAIRMRMEPTPIKPTTEPTTKTAGDIENPEPEAPTAICAWDEEGSKC